MQALPLAQALRQAADAYGARDLGKAEGLCRAILAARPAIVEALTLLGIIAAETGRKDEAVALLRRAVAASPGSASTHSNLGKVLREIGELEAALASLDRAIALDPGHVEAHVNRANALFALKRPEAAIASYDRAIILDSRGHGARGSKVQAMRQAFAAYRERDQRTAEALCRAVLAASPASVEALSLLGAIAAETGRKDEAVALLRRAVAASPDSASAHNTLGKLLIDTGQPEGALASLDRAIALDPGHVEAHANRGNALFALMRLEAAIASYDRAIALDSANHSARNNKALVLLLCGRFEEGWPLYESRWHLAATRKLARDFPQPLWLGKEPIAGRTILLHAEQGLGDAIQFCRYARMVAARGARVILEVPRPLVGLLRGLAGISVLLAKGAALPPFDCHCPLLSLPLAFATRLDTIPAAASYLGADPARIAAWQERLGPRTGKRVGIVWAGNPAHRNDHNRSIALARFRRMLPSGWQAVSLQKEVREADRAALQEGPAITHFGEEIADFADTAALCALMDVVLSVDTSVAHLAGALGRPTWILLPWVPDWRWMLDRADSPWYPSARLYRQDRAGDWDGVIARVGAELAALAPRL